MPHEQVTNYLLASEVPRPNLLVNGGFEQWQRGNGPFASSGNPYTADRWQIQGAGLSSVAMNTADADINLGSIRCAACTYVGGAAAYLAQRFETSTQVRARTIALSFRVKCAVANAVRAYVSTDIGGIVYSPYHSGSNTYETISIVVPVASNISWFDVGTTCAIAATVYVDNAMLVIGSIPSEYVPLHPADDLARCIRYYERLSGAVNIFQLIGYTQDTTHMLVPTPLKVRKLVTPTVTCSAASDFKTNDLVTITAMVMNSANVDIVTLQAAVAAGFPGVGGIRVLDSANVNSYLSFESNP